MRAASPILIWRSAPLAGVALDLVSDRDRVGFAVERARVMLSLQVVARSRYGSDEVPLDRFPGIFPGHPYVDANNPAMTWMILLRF